MCTWCLYSWASALVPVSVNCSVWASRMSHTWEIVFHSSVATYGSFSVRFYSLTWSRRCKNLFEKELHSSLISVTFRLKIDIQNLVHFMFEKQRFRKALKRILPWVPESFARLPLTLFQGFSITDRLIFCSSCTCFLSVMTVMEYNIICFLLSQNKILLEFTIYRILNITADLQEVPGLLPRDKGVVW